MASYDNETYLASLAGARENIGLQIQNTIDEVNRQQQIGVERSGEIPGAVAGTNQRVGQLAQGHTINPMLEGTKGVNLDVQLQGAMNKVRQGVQDRLGTVRNAWNRAAPLVGQGFEERGAQQKGKVSLIGQQLYADNTMARNNYVAGREAEDRQRAFQEQEAARQREFDTWAIGEQARLQREAIAAESAEAQRNRDFQSEQYRLDQLAGALKINPLQPEPLPQLVNRIFRESGGQLPASPEDIALLTGEPLENVQREISKYVAWGVPGIPGI